MICYVVVSNSHIRMISEVYGNRVYNVFTDKETLLPDIKEKEFEVFKEYFFHYSIKPMDCPPFFDEIQDKLGNQISFRNWSNGFSGFKKLNKDLQIKIFDYIYPNFSFYVFGYVQRNIITIFD